MAKLDDFDLRPGDPGNPRRPPPPPPEKPVVESAADEWSSEDDSSDEPIDRHDGPSRSRVVGIAVAVILALGLVVSFWLMSRRVEPPEPGTSAAATQFEPSAAGDEPAPAAPELEAPLPPLDQSDALVRRLVGGLSSHPALTAWLATGNLIRTFTASVENASLGASPSPHLWFLAPREAYRVVEQRGETVPDPANYRRYDVVTEVFTSIDPQATAEVYRRLSGLVQEAFAELGYPDQSFESALAAAVETLVATPIPDTPPALERHVNTYRYADPRLEELAPVQKQLLRMGPDHARRIKGQLRRIAA
ncbi:MAG TPA: DUF3014 domain-containing protein, partial [Thermoanaerobaculia bacterium]|nr:DUF3014 domain-containing protein [Thermoanaerobaculia bacterium]